LLFGCQLTFNKEERSTIVPADDLGEENARHQYKERRTESD
jgi:hypothetical protein